jgi:hypothetical protein
LSEQRILKPPVLAIGGEDQIRSYPDKKHCDADDDGLEAMEGAQLNDVARESKQNARQQHIASYEFDIRRKGDVFLEREKSDEDREWQDVRYG